MREPKKLVEIDSFVPGAEITEMELEDIGWERFGERPDENREPPHNKDAIRIYAWYSSESPRYPKGGTGMTIVGG